VSKAGEAILLLGVRIAESSARAGNIARHSAESEGRLSAHSDHKGVWVYTPIKELTTEEVWISLLNAMPPWGGSYNELIRLYKTAQAGECPFVTSDADTPSCGTNSARFGCWTCTVVEKDNSLESIVAAGQSHLEPLVLLRKRLKEVSEDPNCRSKTRRNGQPGLGPLTYDARAMLLDELLAAQEKVGKILISDVEIRLIRDQWSADKSDELFREVSRSMEFK
jgi:DNA sulfur modification protein DndC